jgi:hypothetical protein
MQKKIIPIYPASYYNSANRIAGFIILAYTIGKSNIPHSGTVIFRTFCSGRVYSANACQDYNMSDL